MTDDLAREVLMELVGTPSVSGSERAAVEAFVRRAAELGLEAEIDEAGNGVASRLEPAADGGPTVDLVLLGHIDTVPGEIPVRVEGDTLHGRGAVDAKGPLAAMLVAGASAELPAGTRLIVAGAVGEETARSPGARFLASRLRPHACIIGEPSGVDGVTLGYKGRLLVRASCVSASAHSAGPDGSSADSLIRWWGRARDLAEELNAGAVREFDRLQASVRSMSSEHTGLEDRATLSVGFRLGPAHHPSELESRLEGLAPRGVSLAFEGHESAHRSHRNDPVVRAVTAGIRVMGMTPRPKLKTGTADMNVVAPVWRCPIAAYGPGDSSLDHTPRERLELRDYLRSIRVLGRALSVLAADPSVRSRSDSSLRTLRP